MTPAVENAFAIPELLEGILLALPPLDVVLVQRVNKNFRDAVRDSTRIQQKLFYKRPSTKDRWNFVGVLNPLLSHFLEHLSIKAESYICDSREQLVSHERNKTVSDGINDSDEIIRIDDGDYVRLWLTPVGGTVPSPPWNGSYAHMAISTLPIDIVIGSDGRGYQKIAWAEKGDVLTMGDVLEAFWIRVGSRG